MIPTDNHSSRGGARVRLVVLHTTEGARTVESLGRYFQTGTDQASYHAAFDDNRTETYVDYPRAAWALRAANPISDNAAFCAFAAWTRAEWLRHPRMLEQAATWVAGRCAARGVPVRRLPLPEVAACARDPRHPGGVIMHRDYTLATRDGSHTDCGDHLPWDVILTQAQQLTTPAPPPVSSRRATEDHTMLITLPATPPPPDLTADPAKWPRSREFTRGLLPPGKGTWRGEGSISSLVCGWAVDANGQAQKDRVPSGWVEYLRVFHHTSGGPGGYRDLKARTLLADVPMIGNWSLPALPLPDWATAFVIRYTAPSELNVGIEYEH